MVLDTNVLVAGLRSRHGASFRVLAQVGRGRFDIAVSVSLVLEYEEALVREASALRLTPHDVRAADGHLCAIARPVEVFFLWRPLLPDAEDDHVLEAAVAGACDAIVTFNTRNFRG